jgi:hypothetical protein
MKKLVLVVALAASGIVSAQTIGELNGQFNSLSTELPGLNQVMSDTTDININLEKENKLYLADQQQKKAILAQEMVKVERDVKAPVELRIQTTVNEYNSRCGRQFNRETEMDQYNRCLSDKARIEVDRQDAITWWVNYSAAWNKEHVDPVNAVILSQNARIVQNNAQIKANFKKFTDAQDRFIEVKAKIDAILPQIKNYCANKTAPAGGKFTHSEWVKYCSNVNWDGASQKLLPMYKWQGTGTN